MKASEYTTLKLTSNMSRLDASKVTLRDILFMTIDGEYFFWHVLAGLGLACFLLGAIIGMLITL